VKKKILTYSKNLNVTGTDQIRKDKNKNRAACQQVRGKQQHAIKDTIDYTADAQISQLESTVDRSGVKRGLQISYLYPPSRHVYT